MPYTKFFRLQYSKNDLAAATATDPLQVRLLRRGCGDLYGMLPLVVGMQLSCGWKHDYAGSPAIYLRLRGSGFSLWRLGP